MTLGDLMRSTFEDDTEMAKMFAYLELKDRIVSEQEMERRREWWEKVLGGEVVDDDESESPETGAGSD